MNLPNIVRGTILPLAIALASLASFATHGADWDRFRGPNGSGTAADARPATTWSESQNVRWKTELPGSGTSSAFVFEAKPEFKLIAQNKLAGDDSQFNATPALADQHPFLRSNRALHCLEAAPPVGTEKNK